MIVIKYNKKGKSPEITIEEIDERLDLPNDMYLIRDCVKKIKEVQESSNSIYRIHIVRSSANNNNCITSGFTAYKTSKI